MSLRKIATQKSRQLGQGMTEYIVITALVALAAIGAFNYFGQSVRVATTAMSSELTGGQSSGLIATQQGTVAAQITTDTVKRNLGTYDSGN
jgi:Flp pilus assembly pilin Flp